MSPELKQICDGNASGIGEFNPELADIFSKYWSDWEIGIQIAWHSSNSKNKSMQNSIICLSPIEKYCLGISKLKRDPDPAEGNITTKGFIKIYLIVFGWNFFSIFEYIKGFSRLN